MCGPSGSIGTIANGKINIPRNHLESSGDCPAMASPTSGSDIAASTRVIAIDVPNDKSITPDPDWHKYITTPAAIGAERPA